MIMKKRKYRWKKIVVNNKTGKFCIFRLYGSRGDMIAGHNEFCPTSKVGADMLGAHAGIWRFVLRGYRRALYKQTGVVFLCVEHCGAGVVGHEIMHAVMFARNHRMSFRQYPVVIKELAEEEEMLYDYTDATMEFYCWFYDVAKKKYG
jgi:hypothetical protein